MKLAEMMILLEPFSPKTRQHLTMLCREGTIPSKRKGKLWIVDDNYVHRTILWRKGQITLDELMNDNSDFVSLSEDDKKKCTRSIRFYAAEHYLEENQYTVPFNSKFIPKDKREIVRKIIEKIAAYYANRNNLLPIKDAAKAMGVSVYQAKRMGLAQKRMQGGVYYDAETVASVTDSRSQYIGIYSLATEILPTVKTAFDIHNDSNRLMLRKFVRESNLRDLAIPAETMPFSDDKKNTFYFPAAYKEVVTSALIPYFRRYGLISERLSMLSDDPFWDTHPKTKKLLDRFSPGKQDNGLVGLMESLIYGLHCEIDECTDEDIEDLLDYADSAKIKIYKQYTVMFVNFCRKHAECRYSVHLKYDPQIVIRNIVDTAPYSFAQYFAFSQFLFSQPMIDQNDLIRKAFSDIKYALLWLYCIWQYCTAWRIGDFFAMPVLRISVTRKQLEEAINNGSFEQEAISLSILLENEINGRQRRPGKTADRQKDYPLVVVFPETLRPVIGTVYAICIVMSGYEAFPVVRFSYKDYEYMFGKKYQKIIGHNVFLNRKANKAFMGTVVDLAEKDPAIKAPVKGYALASFARAHAVTADTLSDMTSRYLQYKLEGLDVNEILMQLWDTGSCSFVPYMLLQAVYGDKFRGLPVRDQTKIMLESRLTAFSAETGARLIRKAYLHDRDVVQTVLSSVADESTARQILQGVITREAPSKQLGIMCLRTPMHLPCANNRSKKCFVCPYRVPQVSSIFLIMSDIEEMIAKMNEALTEGSRKKYILALRDYYYPAAYQMLVFSKEKYGINVTQIANRLADLYEKGGLLYDPDQRKGK